MLECLPRLQRLNQHEKLVVVLPFTLVFVGDGVFLLFSIVLNLLHMKYRINIGSGQIHFCESYETYTGLTFKSSGQIKHLT